MVSDKLLASKSPIWEVISQLNIAYLEILKMERTYVRAKVAPLLKLPKHLARIL